MERSTTLEPVVGTEVRAANGEKIGEVVAVHPVYIVVEKGLLLPDDLYIPRSALARGEGDALVVAVASDDVGRQGWNAPPPGVDRDDETAVFPTGQRVHVDVDEGSGG